MHVEKCIISTILNQMNIVIKNYKEKINFSLVNCSPRFKNVFLHFNILTVLNLFDDNIRLTV